MQLKNPSFSWLGSIYDWGWFCIACRTPPPPPRVAASGKGRGTNELTLVLRDLNSEDLRRRKQRRDDDSAISIKESRSL
jgi:hypothetical protein